MRNRKGKSHKGGKRRSGEGRTATTPDRETTKVKKNTSNGVIPHKAEHEKEDQALSNENDATTTEEEAPAEVNNNVPDGNVPTFTNVATSSTFETDDEEDEFYLINGYKVPKRGYARVRQHSIAAAQQLSIDLAENSHHFLRKGTYAVVIFAILLLFPHYFTVLLRPNLPPIMDGFVAPGFEKVEKTFKYVSNLNILARNILPHVCEPRVDQKKLSDLEEQGIQNKSYTCTQVDLIWLSFQQPIATSVGCSVSETKPTVGTCAAEGFPAWNTSRSHHSGLFCLSQPQPTSREGAPSSQPINQIFYHNQIHS